MSAHAAPASATRAIRAALAAPASATRAIPVALAALAFAACATADPPPGGEEDRTPPLVTEVAPEPGSTLADLRDPAVFHFDERISERDVAASVLVSPRTGDFRVEKGRREVRVRQAGGWSPGIVYRVTLLPGISDMFGNPRAEAAELVFSTGPEISPTVLGGVVTDRMTGQPVPGAAVAATPVGDTVAYVAIADAEGFFAIRFLPPGPYDLRGLRDADGDWTIDAFEPRDQRAVEVAAGDTLVEPLALLAPDTTAATLVRAEFVDSVTLLLAFDDGLDPEDPQADLTVRVLGTSTAHEPAATPLAPHALEALLGAAAGAARDSAAAADSAALAAPGAPEAPDTAAADDDGLLGRPADRAPPADTAAAAAGRDEPAPAGRGVGPGIVGALPPGVEVPRAPDGSRLPTRSWYARLSEPLVAGATYAVLVAGARNVHGLPSGGGEAEVAVPLPEPEDAPDEQPPAAADGGAGGS